MDTHGGNDTIICGGNDRKILTDPLETVLRDFTTDYYQFVS